MLKDLREFIRRGRIQRTIPTNDDMPDKLKEILKSDSNLGVFGSYALKQFTGDDAINPNDIDIAIKVNDLGEFEKKVLKITEELQATKIRDLSVGQMYSDDLYPKYKIPGYKLPIQFIPKYDHGRSMSVCSIAAEESHALSCVCYNVTSLNGKIFTIPEKGRLPLFNKEVVGYDIGNISLKQEEKYRKRGYRIPFIERYPYVWSTGY